MMFIGGAASPRRFTEKISYSHKYKLEKFYEKAAEMDKNKEKVKLSDELLAKVSGGVDSDVVWVPWVPSCPNCRSTDVTVHDGIGYCDRCRVHFEIDMSY